MNYKLYALFLSGLILVSGVFAFPVEVKGKVRHAHTYQEIADVNVFLESSTTGTITDEEGFFQLRLRDTTGRSATLIFEHISFDTLRISLAAAREKNDFYLLPRVIPVPKIVISAQKDLPDINRDIPHSYSIISAKKFEGKGYLDAADLLRNEQSIQVEEELSGRKTVAIRGGNPDDVIILYNGVRMINAYDNVIDLSMINLEEIKRFEVIRGSNTTLYGPEAFSGIINIVPKMNRNYTARFQQRIGTYASGDWNLQLNHTFKDRLNASYSYKKGARKRSYAYEGTENFLLENRITSQSAGLLLDLSDKREDSPSRELSLSYMRSTQDYTNNRLAENLAALNQMLLLNYSGNIFFIDRLNIVGAYQWNDNEQRLTVESGRINRAYLNNSLNFNVDKSLNYRLFSLYFAYQYRNGSLDLEDQRQNFEEEQLGVESALLLQNAHGLASIFKFHYPTESDFLKIADIDFSVRYDRVDNDKSGLKFRSNDSDATEISESNRWSDATYKFSTQLIGQHSKFQLGTFMNYGSNVKFPSMLQQISVPLSLGPNRQASQPNLSPEKNTSLELGLQLLKETVSDTIIAGWQIDANYFKNYYENKFRMYYLPSIPVAFYDNVQNAILSGMELKTRLYLLKRKLTLESGASTYQISERAAFPFKSDSKFIFNIFFDHAGYAFKFYFFRESPQSGWIRDANGVFWETQLKGFSNIDIHLSKQYEYQKFKFIFNLSGRNILNDDTTLEGIAIRDRRIYLSFGVQY